MLKNKSIRFSDGLSFKLEKQFAAGNFATIYKTSLLGIIAKVSVKSNEKAFQAYLNEVNILQKVATTENRQNFISVKGHDIITLKKDEFAILLLEFCKRGSLIDLLTTLPNHQPSETLVMMVIRDIAKALTTMHQLQYTHRDVKMENILLGDDGNFKLCDFGSVTKKVYSQVNDSSTRYIVEEDIEKNTTPMYRAPEQLDLYSNFPINEKVDVFALGILMFIFCFQKPPFESPLSAIRGQYFLPSVHHYSQELINLLKILLTLNPQERPTAEQVLLMIYQGWDLPEFYLEENKIKILEQKQIVQSMQKQSKLINFPLFECIFNFLSVKKQKDSQGEKIDSNTQLQNQQTDWNFNSQVRPYENNLQNQMDPFNTMNFNNQQPYNEQAINEMFMQFEQKQSQEILNQQYVDKKDDELKNPQSEKFDSFIEKNSVFDIKKNQDQPKQIQLSFQSQSNNQIKQQPVKVQVDNTDLLNEDNEQGKKNDKIKLEQQFADLIGDSLIVQDVEGNQLDFNFQSKKFKQQANLIGDLNIELIEFDDS